MASVEIRAEIPVNTDVSARPRDTVPTMSESKTQVEQGVLDKYRHLEHLPRAARCRTAKHAQSGFSSRA